MTKPFALASYTADADLWLLSLLRSSLFALVSLCSRLCCALVSVALVCGSCLFVYCTFVLSVALGCGSCLSCSRRSCSLALLLSCLSLLVSTGGFLALLLSLVPACLDLSCRAAPVFFKASHANSLPLRPRFSSVPLRASLPANADAAYGDGGGRRRARLPLP